MPKGKKYNAAKSPYILKDMEQGQNHFPEALGLEKEERKGRWEKIL